MTSLGALNLEVPCGRLLRTHGDLLAQQPPLQWQHVRRTALVATDQADQPMVDQPPLLGEGQCCQSPTKQDGEAMKDSEPSGENDPSEEKAN